ncbi:hypothetical protein CRG98_006009 [Punica granatum]|uniref:AMP-dependent synthetase/ligase domain-containing protein n=1 Tax=Punica granatum TaxID=22663 RepID=A0A2I0KYT5_PUNGR|nr:hypothetical protein CRG98_006009 [Punica granatum]
MGTKCLTEVNVDDLVSAGLAADEAEQLHRTLRDALLGAGSGGPREVWRELVARRALEPSHPHRLHQLIYYSVYSDWDSDVNGPPLYWFPSLDQAKQTNLGRLMESHGQDLLGTLYKDPVTSFSLFQQFSASRPEVYWSIVLKEIAVKFEAPPRCILDTADKSKHGGTWLPGAVLNIAECCLQPSNHPRKEDNSAAIVWREERDDDSSTVKCMTLRELRERVMLVANALNATFSRGDAIAIDMPMTVNAVIIYLAIILAGMVVVSIADSFAAKEIASRLHISKAKGIFTQDFILRGGRKFPLYR